MKRNQINRLLCVIIVFSLCTCVLAGCNSQNSTSQSTTTAAENQNQQEKESEISDQTSNTPMSEDLTFGLTPFAEQQKLRIAFLAGALSPYIIAEKLGVFDALNIDVEFICFSGGPAEMEANAEWDIATAGAGGLCIGTTAYDMHMIDVMNYEEHHSLWARAGSALAENPEDPENWKVEWVYASGTTCQAVLAVGLQNVGLSLADIDSVNVDLASTFTVFDSGTGDAASTNPFQSTYAEDGDYVLVGTDISLGFQTPSGTVTSQKMLDEHMDLVATTVAVAHLTNEWIYASDENLQQAAEWFYENCQEEGYNCTEEIALKLTEWYHGPTTSEWINSYIETEPDDSGLYTKRELLKVENDFLDPMDFFISEGNYTPENREYVLDNQLVDSSVAKAAKKMLDTAGISY